MPIGQKRKLRKEVGNKLTTVTQRTVVKLSLRSQWSDCKVSAFSMAPRLSIAVVESGEEA